MNKILYRIYRTKPNLTRNECVISPKYAIRRALAKCKAAQWELFLLCMAQDTADAMGAEIHTTVARLESELDRTCDLLATMGFPKKKVHKRKSK